MASHDVARFLAQAERRMQALERSTRLRSSSVPGGLPVYDSVGQLRLTVGQQADGTFAVSASGGKKPPKPAAVVLAPQPLGLTIGWVGLTAVAAGEEGPGAGGPDTGGSWEETWTDPNTTPQYQDPRYASYDGNPPIVDWDDYPTDSTGWYDPDTPVEDDPDAEFATAGGWPSDLDHVSIHLVRDFGAGFDSDFECTASNQVGVFTVADRTLSKTVLGLLPEETYWCRLVAVSASGKESRPSDPVSGVAGKDSIELAQSALEQAIDSLNAIAVSVGILAMDHAVYDGESAPTGGTYHVKDVWIRDSDGQISLWDGTTWVALPPSGFTDAINAANTAAAAAAAASSTASAALLAANGKNQNRWQTYAPTTEANIGGDNWFYTEAGTGNILGQYQGLGGTSWAQRPISSQAIANLDVGKLTAGSGLVNAFTVKTTLTLGDATTNGSIQTYNFASASTGIFIDKNGITLKGATITAPTITAGAAQLDSSGLTVYGTGGTPLMYSSGGDLFLSGQITGKGLVVTGAQGVQTSTSANFGVKFNSSGILAYPNNGSSTPSFALDAATGNVSLLGTIKAGSTITGATITSASGGVTLTMDGGALGWSGSSSGSISAVGSIFFITGGGGQGFQITTANTTVSNQFRMNSGAILTGTMSGGTYSGTVSGTVTGTFNGGSVSSTSVSSTGAVTGNTLVSTSDTGAEGDPAVFGSGGRVKRGSPSARRYKKNIQPMRLDLTAVYAVEDVEFSYRKSSPYYDHDRRHAGFIADQLHNLGLTQFVIYEPDGRVHNVDYPRYAAVAHQAAIRDLNARDLARDAEVRVLRTELAGLRAEVETLHAAA